VRVIEGSADVNHRLEVYRELLATGYTRLDVLEIDVIWPGAWGELTAEGTGLAGKVGIAPLSRGADDLHPATLGGWQLAVLRHSRHPQLAADLVRYLTGAAE
jgi:hypothetical protein